MISVPYLDDECGREGGMFAEPEARCHVCKSRFYLRLLPDNRFECYDQDHWRPRTLNRHDGRYRNG